MNVKSMTIAALFAALLTVSSYFSIPLGPVPIALQVFVVFLIGLVLGERLGNISILLWIVLGAVGLPVFAGGAAGAGVLIGPTGGYVFGYLLCTYVIGRLTRQEQPSYGRTLAILLLGLTLIYTVGYLGFMASFTYFLHKPMNWDKAFYLAVAPFVPFDVLKAALAAYVGIKVRKALMQAGFVSRIL
jgi:biotin transport system substrate-specific component